MDIEIIIMKNHRELTKAKDIEIKMKKNYTEIIRKDTEIIKNPDKHPSYCE